MKVLHVNEHIEQKGGVETYLRSLLPMLADSGIEYSVAFGSGDAEGVPNAHRVESISEVGFNNKKEAYQEMHNTLQQIKPDLINVHNVKNVEVLKACSDYGSTLITMHDYRLVCPSNMFFYKKTRQRCTRTCGPACFVVTLKNHCLTPRLQYSSYFYYRTQWFLKKGRHKVHLMTPSAGAKKRLVKAGCDDEKITVVPLFSSIAPAEISRPLPEKPTMTFIGRIAPNKGSEYFVRALGMLPENVQGVMVGSFNDSSEARIMEMAKKANCENRLILKRWATRQEILEILDNTTVFVFPSLWEETLGLVGLEAMARGVPVVASNLGGVQDWLDHEKNGMLVEPGSAEQIRDAVYKLVNDPEMNKQFGDCGRNTIHTKYMPAHHVKNLISLYEQIAGR